MTSQTLLDKEYNTHTYNTQNLRDHITSFTSNQNKATTSTMYYYILQKFVNYLSNKHITELRNDNANQNLLNYRTYLIKKEVLKSNSIDYYTKIISLFLRKQLKLDIDYIKPLNTGKSKKIKYLEVEDIKGLINTIPQTTKDKEQRARDKAIICTLFTLGLRISELLNLKLEDYITEPNHTYLVIRGKGRATDEREALDIPKTTQDNINQYLHERRANKRTSKYLFCSKNDKQLSRQAINKMLKKLANTYDQNNNTNISPRVSTHTFRHSYARDLLINKGLPISQVKDLLRHSNIETTSKYLQNTDKEINNLRQSMTF